ncbi:hypothetical protein [Catellatospora paridis]|uniref:hypothetical protein n=1 Tax=Catellatospora paridis TaxID=1617086 RepID=UPI0018AFC054|nr:hypothetical protein [Catellatospora paridis]
MLSRVRRATLLLCAAVAAAAALAAPAGADIGSGVSCNVRPQPPECQVIVVVVIDGDDDDNTGGGQMRCWDDGVQVPCYLPGFGWLNSDGCRYIRQTSADPPPGAPQPGAWYQRTCPFFGGAMGVSRTWHADRDAPVIGPVIDRALARLRPPAPVVGLSPRPPVQALVGVPTWLWVEPVSWQPRSATASAGGLSITATATPVRVTWLPGDGTRLVCDGPGTAWTGADTPLGSPACQHTYQRASVNAPGGSMPLSATVTWNVTWAGSGMSGTAGTLTTTTTIAVRVAEVQGLNTGTRP